MNSNNLRKHGCGESHHGSSACHGKVKKDCNFGPFKANDVACLNPPECAIQTETFRNSNRISIPNFGPATPFPSPIVVSGMTGNIIKVTVRLVNLSHTAPGDIGIMLVGPGGQTAMLMLNVGGLADVNNLILTFDDLAPTAISTLVSGTFKSTNNGLVFASFPGAPPSSGGSMLSSYNFTNPNGTWNLFVYDSVNLDAGAIANGWELTITTSTCTP